MQGKGLLLRGSCSILYSHGEQVHVNESFVMWFNTITLKQFTAPFCSLSVWFRFWLWSQLLFDPGIPLCGTTSPHFLLPLWPHPFFYARLGPIRQILFLQVHVLILLLSSVFVHWELLMPVLGCVSSLFVLPFVCWDVYVVEPRGGAGQFTIWSLILIFW